MDNFGYAHFNTQNGERMTSTARFNIPRISARLDEMRRSAFAREIPVSGDETLNFLLTLVRALKPLRILELGTAIGVSGSAMLEACTDAHLTTVEKNAELYSEAVKNFKALGLSDRVDSIFGDAGEVIGNLSGEFDFIFLDCAKVQYVKYLPRLKNLLKRGGVLLADDVLLFGYVTGEVQVPKKRKMLVGHIKEYIEAATGDVELCTTVIGIGDGLAMSVKL